MDRTLAFTYGIGRLAFGAYLLAAPTKLGAVLLGKEANEPAVRAMFRFYGTRDTLLGLGTMRAAVRNEDVTGWLTAGLGADVLDVAVQGVEWNDLPEDKRVKGIAAAAGAAIAGAGLLAKRA
jgi:hypothetical protein